MDYYSLIKDKKGRTTDTQNMDQSLKHFVVEKKPGKRRIYYIIPFI